MLAFIWEGGGLLILLPQIWKPRTWTPEPWKGPEYFIGVLGLALGWLRSRFGSTAAGLFVLASGVGVAAATTLASSREPRWHLPPGGVVLSLLGAALLAAPCGYVSRRYGLYVDRDGRYVQRAEA